VVAIACALGCEQSSPFNVRDAGPPPDEMPPVFVGAKAAFADGAYSFHVTWDAATDDRTAAGGINYRLYVNTQSTNFNFQMPQSTITGATIGAIGALAAASTYYVVARAFDAAGNESGYVKPVRVTTLGDTGQRSLARDLAPILSHTCTDVTSCHGQVTEEQLDLRTPASIYQSLVGVRANERRELMLVAPGDSGASYIVRKVLGALGPRDGERMPLQSAGFPPLTDDQLRILREWIDQGALNN
jgi:hypothetical protein